MNEKFYSLPDSKQNAIINAGYKVFSLNSYKKSPMSEVAEAAGISKSLLFHYFRNKLEFYIFLWDKCAETTIEYLTKYKCYEQTDLFESMSLGLKAKISLTKKYPYIGMFALKAFYETDPSVSAAVQESYQKYFNLKLDRTRLNFDSDKFIAGLDVKMMYQDMFWASEGYLWEKAQGGNLDIDEMEKDFENMMEFWKSIYLRKD